MGNSSKDLEFCTDFTVDSCPCRVLIDGVDYCNFLQTYFNLTCARDEVKIKKLSSLICIHNRNLISEPYDPMIKKIHDQIDKTVRLLEKGEIMSGDIVYCSKVLEDVIFIEGPNWDALTQYNNDKAKYGNAPFSSKVKYKTFDGVIRTCPIACIVKISKGNFFANLKVKGKADIAKQRAEYLEFLARGLGFRVEKCKTRRGYLLKFFGDSQREIDEFLHFYCQDEMAYW